MEIEFSKSNYYGYIVRGDLIGALRYIKQFPEQIGLYNKYMEIFEQEQYITYPIEVNLNCILKIYQQYYNDVFFLSIKKEEAETKLRERLMTFFGIEDKYIELPHIEQNHVTEAFRLKGFYFMGGKTSGYYGPYIWQYAEIKNYEVELPKGIQEYKIVLLDGFITKSWIDYLSFGLISPGGWTNGDGIINCIKSSYDLDSENFTVSLLKHEAQHVMDLSKYKNISSEILEYRAKLVELIYSKERNLLEEFAYESDNSSESNGHSLASSRIIGGFAKKLNLSHAEFSELSIMQIQTVARELFEESERFLNVKL